MKESKNLEFKSGMNNTSLKTVSAYANYGKGIIDLVLMMMVVFVVLKI